MRLYVCDIKGPVVEGYFSLATEASDDDGLPHTLEHMIFLGSEDYPYSGILDLLANKIYAAGTNAWTATDNTTYTLSTVEKQGFLQLLPIYLDHIFYPLLNESGYITEVYHVNGDGEDSGVVYSEMQSCENENDSVVQKAILRRLYPDLACPYRYETGGILRNLRESTSHEKVKQYHQKLYRPNNAAIIVLGQIEPSELIETLEKFEEKILARDLSKVRLEVERPFQRAVAPLSETTEETVCFPCDDAESTNGIVTIGWHGPHVSKSRDLVALNLLLSYLTDSSISPLESHFVTTKSYCSMVTYDVQEFAQTVMSVDFTNTQIEHLDKIKPDFFEIIKGLCEKRVDFDASRMQSLIKTKISELDDQYEDEPHEKLSLLCINDFIYGPLEDQSDFVFRFSEHRFYEDLKSEPNDFWLELADRYLLKAHSATVIAKPSEELMKSLSDEDQRRVEERKRVLGKKGLKELKIKVDKAIEENDEQEVPDVVLKRLKVPSLENIEFRKIEQFFTYNNNIAAGFAPVAVGFDSFGSLKHLQMQVDHLENTKFVQVYMFIDTASLTDSLRVYLELFTELLFELPIRNERVDLSREEAVTELNKDLLEFESSIGIHGRKFSPGIFSQYLCVTTKAPLEFYDLAVKWLKFVVFDSVFTNTQIKTTCLNLLKDIKDCKQHPKKLMRPLLNDLFFKKETNLRQNNFINQEAILKQILEELTLNESKMDPTEPTQIQKDLNEIRNCLLDNKQLRFHLCTDLNKLSEHLVNHNSTKLENVWIDHFPPTLKHNNKLVNIDNQPFTVPLTWNFKKQSTAASKPNSSPTKSQVKRGNATPSPTPSLELLSKVSTPTPNQDFLINLGATESGYVRLFASCDIDSYTHASYPGLLVLIEYFTQAEGPLWEAVRGPGYCYSQSIDINPEKAIIELGLDECSNLVKAYEAMHETFGEHIRNKSEFEADLLESAKNSLIFLLINDLKSMSDYSGYSMNTLFKGHDLNHTPDLIKKVEKVDIKELRRLLKTYIMPMFNEDSANCLIVCNPSKSESIITEFSKKYIFFFMHLFLVR
jgi:Zn-dependent M16 (insulinase) family peptidase